MHQLKDIQGSGQILQLLKHVRVQSPFQKMWLIALHWAQLQSGFHTPLLQDPTIPAPDLEGLYIPNLREILASINGSIVTEHSYTIPLQRIHDKAIMEVVIASKLFTPSECKTINYCRMFLPVHSIADLTLAGRNHVDMSFLALEPSLLSSVSTLIEPLQDRPQTASALRLWQHANRLWCNTVTGGLHRPLGKWLVPGPQLRRVWPFYFDPDTNTLWSRNGESFGVQSRIQISIFRRSTHFHLQTTRHATTLPSKSFPVECHETTTRFIITSQSSVVTTDPPPIPNTPTFLANLPSCQQSLLDQMTTEHSHRKILEMLQASTEPPIIATDGSVKPHSAQGTFAWVLADQEGTLWLRCCRPVSGTPIDSFRSEAHALLSVLVYLNLLADHFQGPISTIKICIHMDSKSNVKRIMWNRHRKRPEFPNETLSPSWDLHQAIHRE
jgi:hypothetical protein